MWTDSMNTPLGRLGAVPKEQIAAAIVRWALVDGDEAVRTITPEDVACSHRSPRPSSYAAFVAIRSTNSPDVRRIRDLGALEPHAELPLARQDEHDVCDRVPALDVGRRRLTAARPGGRGRSRRRPPSCAMIASRAQRWTALAIGASDAT